ncbi:ArsR/SmtB family transcription factor [Sporomusa carbonis]|uniref:ArsR/SmtB family transcription factor n=1 Tax=Sporomusa carbonis TaxID=3076075 RepID=UPI003C7C03E6
MAEDVVSKMTAEIFKSLAHPARIKILKMLVTDERCVCEIIPEVGIEQSNLSQHLGILKKTGYYRLSQRGDKSNIFFAVSNDNRRAKCRGKDITRPSKL